MSTDENDETKTETADKQPAGWDWSQAKWRVFWIVSILSLIADQVTKIWARHSLPTYGHGTGPNGTCVVPDDIIHAVCGGQKVNFISGFWEWRLSMNPGSAFGLFGSLGPDFTKWFLSLIGIGAVIGMVFMLKKARPDQRVLHWALALVAGGAVGNLIDRVYFSVVTDFILWRYKTHEWPVFNIADVVLVVGVGLMFIDIQKENKREKALKQVDKKALKAAKAERARKAGLVKDHRDQE
ncbi:MAG: signal peptidase II [Kofleriaceae bacterium]|nr:signal peptidase II [Kofleriaceae bacterium]